MDDSYIKDFYNNSCDEDSRLISRHGSVEFITTMHYIEKYIRTGDRVLEIGAATGRYSHALARKGYAVDGVELVEHNIEIFRKNTLPDENVTIRQGNALDLSDFPDNTYDITLLLGPLYHLYNNSDKRQAVSEAIRVTKPGGVIFAAHCISDSSIIVNGFVRGGINVAEYIEKGLIDPVTFEAGSDPKEIFDIVRREKIDEVMSVFPVTRLHYAATDGVAPLIREAVDRMDDDTFELFMRYHLATCERADMVGVTCHSLDIFRK